MSSRYFLKEAFKAWWNSDPFTTSAAVAYYAVFSIPSALIIIIALAGSFLSPHVVQSIIIGHIQRVAGSGSAEFLQAILNALYHHQGTRLASTIGIIAIIFSALGIFTQIQASLHSLWHVPVYLTTGLKKFIEQQVIAFLIILLFGAIITISLVASFLWSIIGAFIASRFSQNIYFLNGVNIIQYAGIIFISFFVLYAYLPRVRVSRKGALGGACIGTFLFLIGRELITFYLRVSTSASAYGVVSAFILIMLWVYYSSLIFFFGAAVTYVIDRDQIKA